MKGSKGDIDVNSRLLDSVGEGESGIIGENSIETYTLLSVKQLTSESLIHEAGHSKPMLWDNLEGQGGEGGGEGVQNKGDACVPVADSC